MNAAFGIRTFRRRCHHRKMVVETNAFQHTHTMHIVNHFYFTFAPVLTVGSEQTRLRQSLAMFCNSWCVYQFASLPPSNAAKCMHFNLNFQVCYTVWHRSPFHLSPSHLRVFLRYKTHFNRFWSKTRFRIKTTPDGCVVFFVYCYSPLVHLKSFNLKIYLDETLVIY